jgi:hypothetical protein
MTFDRLWFQRREALFVLECIDGLIPNKLAGYPGQGIKQHLKKGL